MSDNPIKITAIPLEEAAKLLAAAYGRQITTEQVREVAEAGDLIHAGGTINLLEYTAFLVKEAARG